MTQAGLLRHRVTIQQVTEARDTFGGIERTWATLATVWAAVEPLSGREYLAAKQQEAETTTRIRIRYRSGITSQMRVIWGEASYEIVSVIPDPTNARELVLMCVEAQ
jgi:SPP1 family predicted phage head-tail adaptor